MKPHRGNLILCISILSLLLELASLVLVALGVGVFCDPMKPAGGGSVFLRAMGVSIFGSVFGFVAWWMAREDIHKMRVGRMDRAGGVLTRAGRTCGIAGVSIAVAVVFMTTILWLLIDMPGSDGVPRWFR